MESADKIQTDLIKLVSGERLMRLTDVDSGLVLEKKLDLALPVSKQKERLFRVSAAALARPEARAA